MTFATVKEPDNTPFEIEQAGTLTALLEIEQYVSVDGKPEPVT